MLKFRIAAANAPEWVLDLRRRFGIRAVAQPDQDGHQEGGPTTLSDPESWLVGSSVAIRWRSVLRGESCLCAFRNSTSSYANALYGRPPALITSARQASPSDQT